MTIGDGIFYSTILLVLAGSIYAVSIKGKWKAVGKAFGVITVAGIAIGGALVGYEQFQNQEPEPEPEQLMAVIEYMGVKLGAPRVDVTLSHGVPNRESDRELRDDNNYRQILFYDDFYVMLQGEESANLVSRVCTLEAINYTEKDELLDVSHFSNEDILRGMLGAPSSESINKEGTLKLMNYEELNVSFEMKERRVDTICMVDKGLFWAEEYSSATQDDAQ
jgi:hypothetical protein